MRTGNPGLEGLWATVLSQCHVLGLETTAASSNWGGSSFTLLKAGGVLTTQGGTTGMLAIGSSDSLLFPSSTVKFNAYLQVCSGPPPWQ